MMDATRCCRYVIVDALPNDGRRSVCRSHASQIYKKRKKKKRGKGGSQNQPLAIGENISSDQAIQEEGEKRREEGNREE